MSNLDCFVAAVMIADAVVALALLPVSLNPTMGMMNLMTAAISSAVAVVLCRV